MRSNATLAIPQLWIGLGNALVDHARGLTPAGGARLPASRAHGSGSSRQRLSSTDLRLPDRAIGKARSLLWGQILEDCAERRAVAPASRTGSCGAQRAAERRRASRGGAARNGRSSASATAWWRILPPETLSPLARCGIGLHRFFGAEVRELQREGQGRIVEREGAGARDRARHVGDAIMDDRRRPRRPDRHAWSHARSRSSRPGRSRCRPAPSRASSSSASRG